MARSLRRPARLGSPDSRRGRMSSIQGSALVALLLLVPVIGVAQSDDNTTAVPRTPWDHPDLQGIWDFRTLTPLERPHELDGRAFFTDAEAADFEARLLQRWRQGPYRQISPLSSLGGGGDFGTAVTSDKRSSLIVDRPDGRIPPLTPEAEETMRAPRRRPVTERVVEGAVGDGPEDLGLFERCILGINSGPPMVPSVHNNNVQVLQTPGYVVLLNELIHDVRIVPLDGRPHLSATVRQWMGDSRGHWEGDTLVIDTTNFTDKASFNGDFLGRGRRGGSGETFHVVERFTRAGAETLRYEFTVEDPTWWTSPWSAALPMKKTKGPLFEFACHEGNYSMAGMLRGVRAQERAEQAQAR